MQGLLNLLGLVDRERVHGDERRDVRAHSGPLRCGRFVELGRDKRGVGRVPPLYDLLGCVDHERVLSSLRHNLRWRSEALR